MLAASPFSDLTYSGATAGGGEKIRNIDERMNREHCWYRFSCIELSASEFASVAQ